jgi:NAD(P)-dependent dehydrogenase (short-subunit alcohol dehydrogenase family)
MTKFRDTRAVVIGATQGMGLATAQAMLDGGARVILTGTNASNVKQLQTTLNNKNAKVVRADIANMADIHALVKEVQTTLGAVDAVFIFGGIGRFEPFEAVTEAHYDRQFAVNTKGVFFCLQGLLGLIKDGGSITIATVMPSTATPTTSVYMGTKAAITAFAQTLAAELLHRKIRVNTLAPGYIATPSLGLPGLNAQEREAFRAQGVAHTPMRRHGTIGEIVKAALFLGFDATFSTGIELQVDGGASTVDNPQ